MAPVTITRPIRRLLFATSSFKWTRRSRSRVSATVRRPRSSVGVDQVPKRRHFQADLRALAGGGLKLVPCRLQDRMGQAALDIGQVACSQVESRMFGRGLDHADTGDVDPFQVRATDAGGKHEEQQCGSDRVGHSDESSGRLKKLVRPVESAGRPATPSLHPCPG